MFLCICQKMENEKYFMIFKLSDSACFCSGLWVIWVSTAVLPFFATVVTYPATVILGLNLGPLFSYIHFTTYFMNYNITN